MPRKKQKHSGASPLLVVATPVPHNSPPPAPVFVARDPSLPPPEQQARAAPKPQSVQAQAGCAPRLRCAHHVSTLRRQMPVRVLLERGFSDAVTTTWRQQQLRNADAKGPAFRRAFLLSLVDRQRHSSNRAGQFKSRPHVAGVAGSCAWCSTVAGPLDRVHWYTAKRCLRYQ